MAWNKEPQERPLWWDLLMILVALLALVAVMFALDYITSRGAEEPRGPVSIPAKE